MVKATHVTAPARAHASWYSTIRTRPVHKLALLLALLLCAVSSVVVSALEQACMVTMEDGRTSYTIGREAGCSYEDIEAYNPQLDFDALPNGKIVFLPPTCKRCPVPPPCTAFTKLGDNAYDLAAARGCAEADMIAANVGVNLDALPGSTEINVPADKCRCRDQIFGCHYVVRLGDTIGDIADWLECDDDGIDDIAAVNPGLNVDELLERQQMVIPPSCDCPQKLPRRVFPSPPPPPPKPPPAPSPNRSPSPADSNTSAAVGAEVPSDTAADAAQETANDRTNWAAIIGGIAAGLVVAVGLAIAAVVVFLRRSKRAKRNQLHSLQDGSKAPSGVPPGSGRSDFGTSSAIAQQRLATGRLALHAPSGQALHSEAMSRTETWASAVGPHFVEMSWITKDSRAPCTAVSGTSSDPIGTAGFGRGLGLVTTHAATFTTADGALVSEHGYSAAIEYLQDVLDDLYETGTLVLARWTLLSANERRIGGQSVVQFVLDTRTRQDHVIKFFLNDATFQREAQLYARPNVRQMMAAVVHVQPPGVETPRGVQLPGFIVLKRGSSLDEWAFKRQPDFATSLQVLMQIVGRLAALHEAGYVHRDLKPANLLWRIDDNDWTIIDFGCVADLRESGTAHLAYSLPYAPPEVAAAVEAGCKTIEVSPASDMWSLGIVVYELLTGERVFAHSCDRSVVLAQLSGRMPLPWEAGATEGRRRGLRKLGILRRIVLSCVSRDPSQRPSAQGLLAALNSMFQGTMTKLTEFAESGLGGGYEAATSTARVGSVDHQVMPGPEGQGEEATQGTVTRYYTAVHGVESHMAD